VFSVQIIKNKKRVCSKPMSRRFGRSRSDRIALPNTTLAAAAVCTVSMISDEIKPAILACFSLPHSLCPGPVAKTHYHGQQYQTLENKRTR